MKDEKRDFDSEAHSWDEEPGRVRLANDIAAAMIEEITLTSDMDVLDFGCGTGLLTLRLQPFVRSIIGVDDSKGMIAVLKGKIEKKNLVNVRTRFFDMDRGDVLEGRYHLIVSSMTLHHVKETIALLDQFYRIALPSGYLCIADLDAEGGFFHGNKRGVFHFGFDRAGMHRLFMEAGFDNVRDRTAAKVMKPVENGEMGKFSVFIMTGRKRS